MKLLCFFLVTLLSIGVSAQRTQTSRPTTTTIAKYKPPVLFTYLGEFKDSVDVNPLVAEAVIKTPLRIRDAKGAIYTVSSYQFLYRKLVVTENQEMNKKMLTTSVKSSLFKATPLPKIWMDAVTEDLRPGEELYFFDVIVKDAQGRVMRAPDLKLKLKG